jgi:single-stranded-DNA-specific exonuclease
LESTGARQIVVVAGGRPDHSLRSFVKHLGGLVKYALREYDGEVDLHKLAGASGQREVTVRRGLEYMAACGQINVAWPDAETVRLLRGDPQTAGRERIEQIQDELCALLAETEAFRAYFEKQQDLARFFE